MIKDIYEAVAYLTYVAAQTFDTFKEIVADIKYFATGEEMYKSEELSNEELNTILVDSLKTLEKGRPDDFRDFVLTPFYDDEDGILLDAVSDFKEYVEDTKVFQSVNIVWEYAKIRECSYDTEPIKRVRKFLVSMNFRLYNCAFYIAHEYWKYVDDTYVPTKTNDCFTVGGLVTLTDREFYAPDYNDYTYICHSGVYNTGLAIFIGFYEDKEDRTVYHADIKIQRECFENPSNNILRLKGFIPEFEGVTFDFPYFYSSNFGKILAEAVNSVSKKAVELCKKNPEYKKVKLYQE